MSAPNGIHAIRVAGISLLQIVLLTYTYALKGTDSTLCNDTAEVFQHSMTVNSGLS